jgi:hypothetical protein
MNIAEYEHEQEIGARWRPLVEAAGLYDRAHKPANIFMLAGAIMADEIVRQRYAAQPGQNNRFSITEILSSFSVAEKEALRQRILARWSKGQS